MADQDTQNLRNEVEQLRSDLRSLTDSVKEIAANRGEQARARLRDSADVARDRAIRAEKSVEGEVEERPLTSILVVFIGGLVTGLLLHNRH